MKDGIKMDAHYLAKKLYLPGYIFSVRLALGGSDGGSCLQQLRHFFLTCSASGGFLRLQSPWAFSSKSWLKYSTFESSLPCAASRIPALWMYERDCSTYLHIQAFFDDQILFAGVPGATTYVIDPCFREQFEIANPTPQYSAVLAEVPREFVGTEECVSKLVTLLSLQIKRSFQV